MGRWEPDAARRLQQAAFELYTERGYEQTTVANIAARAGLTERAFFRHFADKREVLFERGVPCRPPRARPRRPRVGNPTGGGHSRTRGGQVRIRLGTRPPPRADPRQPGAAGTRAAKLASLAASLAEALRKRGVPATAAELAAATGITILRTALARWIHDPTEQPWTVHVHETIDEPRSLTAERTAAAQA